ncbi:hypothetical protein BerOc1_02709 [Pseudodesulfovibrio hydrargyri]|uniref:Methyl-accepting chemotaxis protein n=1 Tax=Pseudodesulfovibrio hydrargyri TaxID=2125990 RepID=A0A1J5NC21_9BACT|nr:hypothetical protein [Pseudodesulfovibrio hydrargyri]OIQ50767.1 hypothetical protein BerOc1_02709 [Pseudodesulfovibrio hydrargyri]
MRSPLTALLLIMALVSGCVSSRGMTQRTAPMFYSMSSSQAAADNKAAAVEGMGPLELQAAVMAFADTTNSRMDEAAAILEDIGTPQARLTAARMQVYNKASNVEIAAGPYPGIALLDLIVAVSLRRTVWEEYWVPKVFGDAALPVLDIFREVERDVWQLADRIMTPEQEGELIRIIKQWREKYPDSVSVSYVRFEDFGELGLKPSMSRLQAPGGLFASVEKAALVAEDMKVAIDRAFYLVSRMQLQVNAQIKLAYLEMVFQPEIDGIIRDTDKMTGLSERYAEIAEKLPAEVGGQASLLITQLFDNLNTQRDRTMNQAMEGLFKLQTETVSGVMTNVSRERQAALDQALKGLETQQQALFQRMDGLVARSQANLEATLDHAFLLGLMLIGAFFAGLILYRLVAGPRRKRTD